MLFLFRLSNCGYLLETFQLNWQLYTKLRVLSLHKLECFTFLVNSMTCLLSLLISHNIPYRNRPDLPSSIKSCINPKSLQSSNPHGSYYQMNLPACHVFEHSTQFFFQQNCITLLRKEINKYAFGHLSITSRAIGLLEIVNLQHYAQLSLLVFKPHSVSRNV